MMGRHVTYEAHLPALTLVTKRAMSTKTEDLENILRLLALAYSFVGAISVLFAVYLHLEHSLLLRTSSITVLPTVQ